MSPSRLPWWAGPILGLQAGRGHREAYQGDVEEEYRRRCRQSAGRGTRWLLSQLLLGCVPWIRFRADGTGLLRSTVPLLAAGPSVILWLYVFNQPPVLDLVRSLPVQSRAPVAAGLNLFSLAWAGALLGWCRAGSGPLLVLAAAVGGWAVWQGAGTALPGYGLLWGAQAVACLVAAWAWAARRAPSSAGPAGPGA